MYENFAYSCVGHQCPLQENIASIDPNERYITTMTDSYNNYLNWEPLISLIGVPYLLSLGTFGVTFSPTQPHDALVTKDNHLAYLFRSAWHGLNAPGPALISLVTGQNSTSRLNILPTLIGVLGVTLYLSYNIVDGSIPSIPGQLMNLMELHLSHNMLVGPIPSFLEHLSKLVFRFINQNRIRKFDYMWGRL
ncbi:uncharacterized protein LOC111316280 [Durio zibethinus]|uniref:Uncharacterized protein LOC111316280 n=1 Tax=Durio zibethinus TaxID=66656 RepID=A0A6P6BAA5_DURZI|nr:uncharacterized protein LOC111316280 [Durio zibethinus]